MTALVEDRVTNNGLELSQWRAIEPKGPGGGGYRGVFITMAKSGQALISGEAGVLLGLAVGDRARVRTNGEDLAVGRTDAEELSGFKLRKQNSGRQFVLKSRELSRSLALGRYWFHGEQVDGLYVFRRAAA